MSRYRYDQDGWPCRRSTTSPSAGPSSTYAWRRPSISTYCGSYGQSGSSSKHESGVRTKSTPSAVVSTSGSASHGTAEAASAASVSTGSGTVVSAVSVVSGALAGSGTLVAGEPVVDAASTSVSEEPPPHADRTIAATAASDEGAGRPAARPPCRVSRGAGVNGGVVHGAIVRTPRCSVISPSEASCLPRAQYGCTSGVRPRTPRGVRAKSPGGGRHGAPVLPTMTARSTSSRH